MKQSRVGPGEQVRLVGIHLPGGHQSLVGSDLLLMGSVSLRRAAVQILKLLKILSHFTFPFC